MTSAFTVVVNVAKLKLTATPPSSSYHVFVDPSQMGIVLEFMELVRYLWDLKDSIILTHNHAHIHYLEDIRILSLFKHVEVEYFTPSPYENVRMKNLLEKLKFFDRSTGQSTPKIIFSRFEKNSISNKETGVLNNLNNSMSLENSFQEKIDCNEVRQDSLRTDSHDQRSKALALVQCKSQSSFDDNKTTLNNQLSTVLKSPSAELLKVQNGEELNRACPNNITSKPTQASSIKPRGKRPQNLKPFSLGAMLNALRSSSSQEENVVSQASLDEKQNDLDKTNENELQDEEDSSINILPSKKRKRVRRPRKRKRNEDGSTPSNLNSNTVNSHNISNVSHEISFEAPTTSNGNHVRFDSESDEEGDSYETSRIVNVSYETTEEINAKGKTDEKLETEGVICRLPWAKLDSGKEEEAGLQEMDEEQNMNNSIAEELSKNLDNKVEDKSNSQQFDSLKTLFLFKKQNVSPVAYRNIQPNLMKSFNGSPRMKQEEKSN